MSKISFTKLGLKKQDKVQTLSYNGNDIEVKQYLPINDKLILISNVINNAADTNNFMNPVKLDLFGTLEIVYAYTNISFTDKQKEDPAKLYDLLTENYVIDSILALIPEEELEFVWNGIEECATAIYEYNNSVMGILENVNRDYSNLNLETDEITEKLTNPENLSLVRDVLSKLG